MLKPEIYWHTTVRLPDASSLITLPEKVDVAIIGGGYTGLSAARTLAQNGVKAAVLLTQRRHGADGSESRNEDSPQKIWTRNCRTVISILS